MSRLSVCLLTRDEEHNVERAVRSVSGVADEVLVADTGSTDRTIEIARGLGAEVIPFAWDDDFSGGRNLLLARASGDWVLWLNPDEELLPISHGLVRELIESGNDVFGYVARVQGVTRADRPDQFSETRDLRLFRRRPDLRYVGRLHPAFDAESAKAVAADGQQVRDSEIAIRQHAYTSVVTGPKIRWAVRLLEKELRDRPGQLHYLIEYGRNLLMLDDPKGHAVMAEAAEQIRPFLDGPSAPSPDVQILLDYALTTPAGLNRSGISPELAVELVLRWFSNSPPLIWLMAGKAFANKAWPQSVMLLERLVQLGRTGDYDRSHPFDPRIIGPWALLNLGQSFRALRSVDEARLCFRALLDDPDFAEQGKKLLSELDAGPPAPV